MATTTNYKSKNQQLSSDKKLEQAKVDFNKLMLRIKPFIKKSNIILASTEGKWYDTTATPENIVLENSNYH